jgi:hypothetical protein
LLQILGAVTLSPSPIGKTQSRHAQRLDKTIWGEKGNFCERGGTFDPKE